uniref:TonB-dependent receptor n=1 Tax=Desulfatirhabdium butyrativorans TaxID=340467 RepID=A0A7C4MPU0_9BACT
MTDLFRSNLVSKNFGRKDDKKIVSILFFEGFGKATRHDSSTKEENMQRSIFVMGVLWLCLTLGGYPFVNAAENETELETIVVTATKTPKKLEHIPAVVTVIGKEDIETMPAKTVSDLLANLPGVYVHEPQGVGLVTPQSTQLSGNGFPAANLVLLDGQKINVPFTDYAYLTTIPLRAVERIEVIRGPFSALYGSSAGGGIINIITKDGGKKPYVTPWGSAGDFGRFDGGVDMGIVWKEHSLGIFYDYREVDNYWLYDDQNVDDRNRDYRHNRFHSKLTGMFSNSTSYSLSGGTIEGKTGFGLSSTYKLENYQDIQQPYINFQIANRPNQHLELKAQVDALHTEHQYYGETLESITYPIFGPPVPKFTYKPSINDTKANRYRADVSGNYTINDQSILTVGVETVRTDATKAIYDQNTGNLLAVQGRPGEKADKSDTLYSFYTQYDLLFAEDFELVIGGRYDDYDSYGSELSPKGTFCWNYSPTGNVKFSVGKGFRAPNLNELYSPPWSIAPFIVYMGNPNLKAETTWSYQLSAEQRFWDKKFYVRLTPYATDGENFITSVRRPDPSNPGGQIMMPENINEVQIRGTDVETGYDVHKHLTFYINYTYNETRNGKTDNILDGYPRNSGAIGFRHRYPINEDWRVVDSYAIRYRGEYTDTTWSNPPVIGEVGDYLFHTARLGLIWKDMVHLDVDLYNIFNNRSETGVNVYLPEFNYMVSLSVQFVF